MNAVSLTSGMRQNLFSMQRTSRLLATNAIRLNTGKKVSSAMDNAVSFFTSIQHMNRANDLAMRKAEMGEGIQTIQAALNGIDSMIDLIGSAESITQSALSAETSEERETLAEQYNETLNQISAVADDASYKGVGLLRCPPESLCVNLNEKGDSSLTVEGECASVDGLGLNSVANSGIGEAEAVGTEFQVNTNTTNDQETPSVTGLSDGGFVVTYDSNDDIYGQRYDNVGNQVGGEFQVNTNTTGWQRRASVTGLSDGGFVVTWNSGHDVNQRIYGQRYDSAGNQVGGEFRVNNDVAFNQKDSSVTALSDGGFVVTWNSDRLGDDSYGQQYDSAGNQVGGQFQVNTNTGSNQIGPSVTALSDGGFVVTWYSNHTGGYEIYGQRYDSAGNQVGEEFHVNTNTTNSQISPSVTVLSDGGFMVAWQSDHTGGYEIYGQRFSVPPDTGTSWTSPTNIQTSLDELAAAKERLRTLQEKFSTNLNIITTRSSFTDSIVNILETGADNLINADMNEEGANALMLQTRQSLGTTSLSMAAQAAQSVLRLFN